MKLTAKPSKAFESHPEYTGQAVCVDVTPPKTVQTDFGPKEQFRLVFETTLLRDDGKPYLVWSRGFTPSLGEKAALRAFLKQWMGRDLTAQEQEEFDTETLIGRSAHVVIVHNESNGQTYANIGLIRPDKSAQPLKPSGKYVRVKDRDLQQGKDANFQRIQQPASAASQAAEDWRYTKVHLGKHRGLELCDLDVDSIRKLCDRWLPEAKAMPKPKADDVRLIAALEKATEELGIAAAAANDDLPY